MKQLLIILLLISTSVSAQQKDSIIINHHTYYSGETYLDSSKVDFSKMHLNRKNIKSVNQVNCSKSKIHSSRDVGVTFITRRKNDSLILLDAMILSVRKSNAMTNDEKISLIIDGEFIEDTEGHFIEEGFIKKISILVYDPKQKGTHLFRNPIIVITTKTKRDK